MMQSGNQNFNQIEQSANRNEQRRLHRVNEDASKIGTQLLSGAKCIIPAKTFLLGEYAAIHHKSAIVLTTWPCFELSWGYVVKDESKPHKNSGYTLENISSMIPGIDPLSPAGRWWHDHGPLESIVLHWHDPYQGRGGLGASSAQFIGVYHAWHALSSRTIDMSLLLQDYLSYAWCGVGLQPSGYDVIAQCHEQCVYIQQSNQQVDVLSWPFADIDFLLLRTGNKLATHHHLTNEPELKNTDVLSMVVDDAYKAFQTIDSQQLIHAINQYHQLLYQAGLVAIESQLLIAQLQQDPNILAVKGCGAMGADVILILMLSDHSKRLQKTLVQNGWEIVASSAQLFQ